MVSGNFAAAPFVEAKAEASEDGEWDTEILPCCVERNPADQLTEAEALHRLIVVARCHESDCAPTVAECLSAVPPSPKVHNDLY